MNSLYLALIPRSIVGVLAILVWVIQRRTESKAILFACAACASGICDLIREMGLQRHYRIAAASGDTSFRLLNITESYLTSLNAFLPQIGRLKPAHANLIMRFHYAMRVAEDTVRFRAGPDHAHWHTAGREMNRYVADKIDDILSYGDQITRLVGQRVGVSA